MPSAVWTKGQEPCTMFLVGHRDDSNSRKVYHLPNTLSRAWAGNTCSWRVSAAAMNSAMSYLAPNPPQLYRLPICTLALITCAVLFKKMSIHMSTRQYRSLPEKESCYTPCDQSSSTMQMSWLGSSQMRTSKPPYNTPPFCLCTRLEEFAGIHFYARQFVDGVSLAALRMQGGVIDDEVALQFITSVADAFCHLAGDRIATSPLTADDLFISHDGHARINNLATCVNRAGTLVTPAQRDIRALAHFIVERLPNRTPQSASLRALFVKMLQAGIDGYLDWPAVRHAVEGVELPLRPEPTWLSQPGTDLTRSVLLTEPTASTHQVRSSKQRNIVASIGSAAFASTPSSSLLARFMRAWR